MTRQHVRVAIIGAGFGGLGAAVRLSQSGYDDFVVIERADEVGGTWQANTYPGAQCDIPSILYSFSFAPNSKWTRFYPLQAELKQYMKDIVTNFGLSERLRLGHEVTAAQWDDDAQHWLLDTTKGNWSADIVIAAMGPFSQPSVPKLTGLETFEGTWYHSAQWNHDHDPAGERVAVIGTGASAVQFIPRLQPVVDHMTVFQRTPTWIMPHPDRPVQSPVKAMFSLAPVTQRLARKALDLLQESLVPGLVYQPALLKGMAAVARLHLRNQVRDAELREKLTPRYSFGCKRPTFSNKYYPALASDNVDVVTTGISHVEKDAIVTTDGERHEVDTIIFGTGFSITDNAAFELFRGRNGVSLAEQWRGGQMKAHLGTTIENFPNMFMLLGPNAVVYTSQVVTIECQVEYVLGALREMDANKLTSLEVRPEVQAEFVEKTDKKLAHSVWNSGGCSSYYLTPGGRNYTFWPGFNASFRRKMENFDASEYIARTDEREPAVAAAGGS